jgi:hemin uptake protein HemP
MNEEELLGGDRSCLIKKTLRTMSSNKTNKSDGGVFIRHYNK